MNSGFADVLSFWFGSAESGERGLPRKCWFEKNPEFDAAIRTMFISTWEDAHAGALAAWERGPLSALALVVVLDQFPRNMFRGEPRAFLTDAMALRAARNAVDRGFDRCLRPTERWFIYLPFEHSEDIAAQRRSLALFGGIAEHPQASGSLDYARRHFEIIARFGRFPHRNAILGRDSTREELEFLAAPGSSF